MAQSADDPQNLNNSTGDNPPSQLNSNTEQNDREATELHAYYGSAERELNGSATPPTVQTGGSPSTVSGNASAVKTFWRRHVVATVPHDACRDHFALERTYLGYFRTSLALVFLSVFIAQLFRLQHTEHPDPVFGFYVLGIPLSCICIGAAILVNLLGTYRFWRQQNAMMRGKIHAGGWEVYATFVTVLLTVIMLFVLIMAVNISKG
ncbi:MAG: hypothetical protein Q9166_003839 [cf. Caloplaca sp. 2 TL-2023]